MFGGIHGEISVEIPWKNLQAWTYVSIVKGIPYIIPFEIPGEISEFFKETRGTVSRWSFKDFFLTPGEIPRKISEAIPETICEGFSGEKFEERHGQKETLRGIFSEIVVKIILRNSAIIIFL